MKVSTVLLIVQNNSFPFDRRVFKEAKSLTNAHYEVFIISPMSSIDRERESMVEGIHVYRYKSYQSNGSALGFIKEYLYSLTNIYFLFIKLFLKHRFSVVHVANPPDFFWPLALARKLLNYKFIYDQHDLSPEMFTLKYKNKIVYKILAFNEYLSVCLSDRVIVVNESFKKRSLKLWNSKPSKYAVVYNGPSSPFLPTDTVTLKHKYAGRKVVLYVGLMTKNDNVEVLITIAEKYIKEYGSKNIVFVLLGDGDSRSAIQSEVQKCNLSDYFEFIGLVEYNTVLNYLSIADVCIATDLPNGLNEKLTLVKTLEYMMAEKPFIAFNLEETKQISGDAGLFADNINDFVFKIKYLIDSPDIALTIGKIGRQRVLENYSWDIGEKELLRVYEEL